jgi:WD40 repeat protein
MFQLEGGSSTTSSALASANSSASTNISSSVMQTAAYTLTKIQDFKGHTDSVDALAWHPTQDSIFVSTSGDKSIRIWDSKQMKQHRYEKTS